MIRLQRVGRKHEPVFRLVLTDSKNGPKSGKFLEILGNFDARRSEKAVFDSEKIKHFIKMGAKLSDTVHNILITMKVIDGKKINKLPKKKPIVSEKEHDNKENGGQTSEEPKEEMIEKQPVAETQPTTEGEGVKE